MRCDDVRGLLPDRLDDLLEAEVSTALDEHVRGCAACREAKGRTASVREALYRPWAIDRPVAQPGVRRLALALLRYAAVFVAGVLVAQQFGWSRATASAPTVAPKVVTTPLPASPTSDYLMRIR